MSYRVRYMPQVIAAINLQVQYFLEQQVAPERISAWLGELYDLADSLEHFPRRHAIHEESTAAMGTEVRSVVFGNYLIFYRVDDAQRRVDVVHFRHAAQETNQLADDSK
ncbi:MAG TPA: type II toxin-antitoxin system RelE/ParE family toxin [Phycisphaerae bacterium]|nr:type II toxin-antitoxin system RelE/ParE family toxin [Caldilineaceae bacterium]HRX84569.1 type II toxin-antitoxin system RelE/ParE family toxin [Phycisphaerae bacterium]